MYDSEHLSKTDGGLKVCHLHISSSIYICIDILISSSPNYWYFATPSDCIHKKRERLKPKTHLLTQIKQHRCKSSFFLKWHFPKKAAPTANLTELCNDIGLLWVRKEKKRNTRQVRHPLSRELWQLNMNAVFWSLTRSVSAVLFTVMETVPPHICLPAKSMPRGAIFKWARAGKPSWSRHFLFLFFSLSIILHNTLCASFWISAGQSSKQPQKIQKNIVCLKKKSHLSNIT